MRARLLYPLVIGLVLLAIYGAGLPQPPEQHPLTELPEGFPPVKWPKGNEFTPERWALGKRLFFDPVMSRDSSISCASCHHPGRAFSDSVAFSPGVENAPGVRNAPTLTNVAYHPHFLREGSVPTLEMQVLVPIQEHNEFDFNILLIAKRLQRDSAYCQLSRNAYQRKPDHYVITRALGVFERTLISGNSPYDVWKRTGNAAAMSADAHAGRELFFSKRTGCANCHSGFNFTNYQFENTGLYLHYPDSGRMRFTHNEADRARFKVPTLRNVALTAPFMHDGSLPTLQAVVQHFNSGGLPHKNKSELLDSLHLSEMEQAQLVAFLEALTDTSFANRSAFRPTQ